MLPTPSPSEHYRLALLRGLGVKRPGPKLLTGARKMLLCLWCRVDICARAAVGPLLRAERLLNRCWLLEKYTRLRLPCIAYLLPSASAAASASLETLTLAAFIHCASPLRVPQRLFGTSCPSKRLPYSHATIFRASSTCLPYRRGTCPLAGETQLVRGPFLP